MTSYEQGFVSKCAENNIDPYIKEAGKGTVTLASVMAALSLVGTPKEVIAGGCRGGRCVRSARSALSIARPITPGSSFLDPGTEYAKLGLLDQVGNIAGTPEWITKQTGKKVK